MYRELWVRVRALQARRIPCEYCRLPYVCLAERDAKVSAAGMQLLTSAEALQGRLDEAVRRRLLRWDRKARWEKGACPRCRRFQPWMVRRSRWRILPAWGCGSLLAGTFLLGTLGVILRPTTRAGDWIFAVPAAVFALGLYLGWRRTVPSGVLAAPSDPMAIADEEFRSLLTHCRETEREPLAEWYLSVHEAVPEGRFLVSMGCRDFTGEGFFPEELRSEAVLAEP